MAKKPLSVGVKAALIAAFAAIIVALIPLLRHSPATTSQSVNNSPGAMQAGRDINNVNINPNNQTDFIEGTDINRKQMEYEFPFGYAIFYFGQNKIQRCEIFKNGLMDWKADMDAVEIEPNFNTGIVTWKIPNITAISPGGHGLNLEIGMQTMTCELKRKAVARCGVYAGNNPVLYVATLNANQRTPVFAIGFRIPSPDEERANKK